MHSAAKSPVGPVSPPPCVRPRDSVAHSSLLGELRLVLTAKNATRATAVQRRIALTDELRADRQTASPALVEQYRNRHFGRLQSDSAEMADVPMRSAASGRGDGVGGKPVGDNDATRRSSSIGSNGNANPTDEAIAAAEPADVYDNALGWASSLLDKYNGLQRQLDELQRQVDFLHRKLRKTHPMRRARRPRRHSGKPAKMTPPDAAEPLAEQATTVQQQFPPIPPPMPPPPPAKVSLVEAPPERSVPTLFRQIREYKLNRYFYARSPETHALNGWPVRHVQVPRPLDGSVSVHRPDRPRFVTG